MQMKIVFSAVQTMLIKDKANRSSTGRWLMA